MALVHAAPQLAMQLMQATFIGLQTQNKDQLGWARLASEQLGYTKPKDGVVINNNNSMSNQTMNVSSSKSFDSIVRELAEQKKQVSTFDSVATPTLMQIGNRLDGEE
jgi:hypothetical protein